MADALIAQDMQTSGNAMRYHDSIPANSSEVDRTSRRTRDDLQKLLPKGLILDQQRSIPNCPYQVFDCFDKRLGLDKPIRRTLTIVELTAPVDELLKTITEFTAQHLKGVAQPQEAALLDERSAYLILPWFPAILSDQIPATGLATRRLAWTLWAQLLEELAELHRHGFAHGNLRTATISLDTPTLTQRSRAWIGHPNLHRFRRLIDGDTVTSTSRETFLLDQDGVSTEFERKDLFALGLVAIELFAGASARRKLESTAPESSSIAVTFLRNQMWWWRRRFLIGPLLTNDHNCLRNACALQARWQYILQGERLAKQITAVFLIVAMLVVFSGIASLARPQENPKRQVSSTDSRRLDELESVLNTARSQLAESNTELETLRRRTSKQAASPSLEAEARQLWQHKFAGHPSREYDQITGSLQPKPITGVQEKLGEWKLLTRPVESDLQALLATSPEGKIRFTASGKAYVVFQQTPWDEPLKSGLAQAVWRDAIADQSASDAKIDSAVQILSKCSNDNWLKNELQAFSCRLLARRAAWTRWESQPGKLIEPWRRLIETPWDKTVQIAEPERLLALEAAEKSWRAVAGRGDLTWSEFRSQLKDAVGDNPKAAEITSVWIDQFNQLNANSRVQVTLVSGHSPKGCGVYRTIDVHVGGSFLPVDDEYTGDTWNSETDHIYPDSRKISFPWQPGQSIQIYVYSPRTVYRVGSRSPLIHQKYSGPIALWLMGQDQQITGGSGENQHSLQFRVEACPGPPPLPAELEKLQNVLPR